MALLNGDAGVKMSAAEIAELLGAELQNCADASFSVCGFSTDTRAIEKGNCFIAIRGENFNGNVYAKQAAEKGAVLCILSQIPEELPDAPYLLVEDSVNAYGKIANLYRRKCGAKGLRVVGVTGSSGKTTVKDMTAHVLAAKFRTYATSGNFNNHIGVPRTLLHLPEDTEIAVIEMGMNHFGEIDYLSHIAQPDLALITNIGTAHIGNLGSQENILKAKLEILNGMDGGELLVPADDPFLLGARAEIEKRVKVRYSSRMDNDAAELFADHITESADNTKFSLHYNGGDAEVLLPMTGLHNVTDALLAVHIGLRCGMTLAECAAALADFVPGAMRSERVQIGNVTVIRDYYNANPEAMAAALHSLQTIAGDAQKWAILGNMNELGDYASDRHRELGELCRTGTDKAFFCGLNYKDFADGYGSGEASFAEQSELIEALEAALASYDNTPLCVLIKGSRGMHMERADEVLEKYLRGE
jgi:UDP-N-acetylmuramoyl-tripeptide--D-alanyl-D-alanine ligase